MVACLPPAPGPIFEDYDDLESGYSREFISEDLLTPTSRGYNAKRDTTHHWVLCKLTRPKKSEFQLCSENGDFLLCAKLVDKAYYISTYEDFPASCDEKALRHVERGGAGGPVQRLSRGHVLLGRRQRVHRLQEGRV